MGRAGLAVAVVVAAAGAVVVLGPGPADPVVGPAVVLGAVLALALSAWR